jgi:hypothetical protein
LEDEIATPTFTENINELASPYAIYHFLCDNVSKVVRPGAYGYATQIGYVLL